MAITHPKVNTLKIDIYTTLTNGHKYFSIPVGTKLSELTLPDELDPEVLSLSPFKTRLEINEDKPHSALDAKNIIQQIEKKGFAIHSSNQTIQLK